MVKSPINCTLIKSDNFIHTTLVHVIKVYMQFIFLNHLREFLNQEPIEHYKGICSEKSPTALGKANHKPHVIQSISFCYILWYFSTNSNCTTK